MSNYKSSSAAADLKVLVVAPRFPVIHQPWIDTYLEQLLLNGLEPAIYSANRGELGAYHAKVDRLGLRRYVLDFLLHKDFLGREIAKFIVTHPLRALSSWREVWRKSKIFQSHSISRLPAAVKMYSFAAKRGLFAGVNVVHSHEEIAAYQFLHMALLFNVPLVVSFHGFPPPGVGQLSQAKRSMLYRFAQRVLVNTQYSAGQVKSLGCPDEKVVVLPQGLPLDDFPFLERLSPGAGESLELLTVGRFHRDKGQGYALVALRRLLDLGVSAHWHFIGVGPDLMRLKKLGQRLGLNDAISFYEEMEQSQLRSFYQRCHLFVLSSTDDPNGKHAETQGVVLQEAQASGCIPIASLVGGIPEVVHNNRDAILVKHKSSRAIAGAVMFLLQRPKEWSSFQQVGRNNVQENFSAAVVGKSMAAILRSIARKP